MSDAVIVALIVAVPATLSALAAVLVGLRTGRAVENVHVAINSRLTQLLESSTALAASNATAAEKQRARREEKST